MKQKITIQEIDFPKKKSVREDVKWVCDSLGLMKGRDTEDICFKIVYEILKLVRANRLISTEDISKTLKIEPARINHHIRTLLETGIFYREKRKIALRGGSLSAAIEEIKRDSETIFNRMIEISEKIDRSLKLRSPKRK